MSMRLLRRDLVAALVTGLLGATASVGACSSTENQQPPVFNATTSGPGTGGGAGGEGGAGGGGGVDPACLGPDGCYQCAPSSDTQFHNACTDAQCAPFDNAARLPLYNGGELPPLP
ncbi:hypothetical protein [Chondromyces apiculatus]|uniref:Lipoprotein n=1 Tax=Chondromyces apiculatus DSM 436 TaxID=1192034 RepID=A0A017T1B3_9BACT|nr:hypothetical protein [Chondromyces apiculatus]EYF02620.1 Hypothetical protein CAP_6650 [Chondromyces apiculatus DSM 436]